MTNTFGDYVRARREARRRDDRDFSVRQVAARIGIEPSYLSKIERGEQRPPSEATIVKLAGDLDEDADALLAMAGKVSGDLQEVIRRRPRLFAARSEAEAQAAPRLEAPCIDRDGAPILRRQVDRRPAEPRQHAHPDVAGKVKRHVCADIEPDFRF